MRCLAPLFLLCPFLLCPLLLPAAQAADTLASGSYARACQDAAALVAEDLSPPTDGLTQCDKALTDEALTLRDLAATYVNRGVLELGSHLYPQSINDFHAALVLAPGSGDAYVDLGAAELGQSRFAQAIADFDRGLSLNTQARAKAYFDRGEAEDALGQATPAYHDFAMALSLRPDWPIAKAELARFSVTSQ